MKLRDISYLVKPLMVSFASLKFVCSPLSPITEFTNSILTVIPKTTEQTTSGELYRGKLLEAEDSMNLQMTNVTVTHRDGSVDSMQSCFLRGSKIVFVTMPDILKHAPVFNKTSSKGSTQAPTANILKARGRGLGRGGRPVTGTRRPPK